jgi:hypothetical protein
MGVFWRERRTSTQVGNDRAGAGKRSGFMDAPRDGSLVAVSTNDKSGARPSPPNEWPWLASVSQLTPRFAGIGDVCDAGHAGILLQRMAAQR